MDTDILFINCSHAEFPYVPMGTFGLCDFLERHNIRSRIINLSLYPTRDMEDVLINKVLESRPRYIGLILHWKELLSACVQTGSLLKEHFSEVPIVVGGLTASCFASELLADLKFVDYIIKGDSELPLLRLLSTTPPESIENLSYRNNGSIVHSQKHYLADCDLLNSISFSRLDFLDDYQLYLERIDSYLGFPIFVGRGCMFSCEYCGGSRSAFKIHSGRTKLSSRSVENIVSDTLMLSERYDCNHVLLSHAVSFCKPILQALLDVPTQRKWTINLEPWDEPDEELLRLHKQVNEGATKRPSLILTPKKNGAADSQAVARQGSRSRKLTLDQTVDLAMYCHVDIFKGYFGSQHIDLKALFEELADVHRLRKLYKHGDVSVHLLAFSTDPASYFSSTTSVMTSRLSLAAINRAILFDRNLSTNILLHRPPSLTAEEQQVFQRILHFSEFLFRNAPCVYWFLTDLFEFDDYRSLIEQASNYYFYEADDDFYEISPGNVILALNCLKISLQKSDKSTPLVRDLLNLMMKYEAARRIRRERQKPSNKSPRYLTLNQDRALTSRYNFELYSGEIRNQSNGTPPISSLQENEEQSFYLLFDSGVERFSMEEGEMLRMFDGVHETRDVASVLAAQKDVECDWVESRIEALYQQGVLIHR